MPTLLSEPVEIGVSEFVPTRSGQGRWGPVELATPSKLLPNVGEYLDLGEKGMIRVIAIVVDGTSGGGRVTLYGQRVHQPNPL